MFRVLRLGALALACLASPAAAQLCPVVRTVCPAACDSTTVQGAVDAIPSPLTGHSCVVIQHAGPFSEEITVQNFTLAGSSITIMADPGLGARPVFTPPTTATSAFKLLNASVTLAGLDIRPPTGLQYGIQATSSSVRVSSVNLVAPGVISQAGVLLQSLSEIAYSSISVTLAHGVQIAGSSNTIHYSTAANARSNFNALWIVSGDHNRVENSIVTNSIGPALVLGAGAEFNRVYRTSATNSALGGQDALSLTGASSNTIDGCYLGSRTGGVVLEAFSHWNTIVRSTAASSTGWAMFLSQSSSNTFTQGFLRSGTSSSLLLASDSDHNTVSFTTVTSGANPGAAVSVDDSDSNRFSNLYVQGLNGAAISVSGSPDAAKNNTFTRAYLLNSAAVAPTILVEAGTNPGGGNSFSSFTAVNYGGAPALYVDPRQPDTEIVAGVLAAVAGYAAVIQGEDARLAQSTLFGANGALVYGSTGTILNSNTIVAAGAGNGVTVAGGSVDVTLTSNVVVGVNADVGVLISSGNSGSIVVSTNLVGGFRVGVALSTAAAGSQVWFTSNTVLMRLSASTDTAGILVDGLQTGATVQENGVVFRATSTMGAFTAYAIRARSSAGVVFERNRLVNSGSVAGGAVELMRLDDMDAAEVRFNDFYSTGTSLTSAHLLRVRADSTNVRVRNNIFFSSHAVTGSSSTLTVADAASQAGFAADYNDYFSSNAALGFSWGGTGAEGLAAWRALSGGDAGSISAHPLWADPGSGAEDFHPRSAAGRYAAGSGYVLTDSTTSPTIDAGDPAAAFAAEPAPNGGRVNMGSYANTAEASKSLAPPVSNARIFALHASSVTANWSPVPASSGYLLQSSLDSAFGTVVESSSTAVASLSTLTLSNVAQDATYYFRVGSLNVDGIPNHVFIGSVSVNLAPGVIVDLSTLAAPGEDMARASWTAPGSNGFVGTAAFYDIRYSENPITPANFAAATVWNSARPVGGPAGTVESEIITGLASGTTYYIAMKTRDAAGNTSGLSNVAQYLAGADVLPAVVSYGPPDGASGLSISTTVWVKFSKAVSTTTFEGGGFVLRGVVDKDGAAVSQPVSWVAVFSTTTRVAVFTPGFLNKNTTFEVTVSTRVRDTFGQPLFASATWRFGTLFDRTESNTIVSPSGVRFSVPAGTFPSDGRIDASTTVANSAAIQAANSKLLTFDGFARPIQLFEFTALDGASAAMQPTGALTATVSYADADSDGMVDGVSPPVRTNTLALWWLDAAGQSWVRLPGSSGGAANTLSSPLTHFSTFALIGGEDADLDRAFAFPVPYVPSEQATRVITFRNLSSRAKIRIYTAAGAFVRAIDESDGDGQATWDVRNEAGEPAASGVYFYLITNAAHKKRGKLVVIR